MCLKINMQLFLLHGYNVNNTYLSLPFIFTISITHIQWEVLAHLARQSRGVSTSTKRYVILRLLKVKLTRAEGIFKAATNLRRLVWFIDL